MSECAVTDCSKPIDARHLCATHYRAWLRHEDIGEADERAGRLVDRQAPVVCVCPQPHPDGMGMCTTCGRLVVTFARANLERYQELYPGEWERAMTLGLKP